MPSANAFAQLGLFVRHDFLDPEDCSRLIVEVSEVPSEHGRLVRNGVDGILDESTRKVSSAKVSKDTRTRLKERFLELVPEVEAHFGIPLGGCETPGFLVYGQGAFFAPHRDVGPDDPPDIRRRVVSSIVFLNRQAGEGGADDGYIGGTLRFHGLLENPAFASCPLPFEPAPGMLVAFKSDLLHEVQPVTFGQRFTVVTWFLER